MPCDLAAVEARLAELRGLEPKKLARDRAKLVLAHGQALARFVTQALDELPKDTASAAAADPMKPLARYAREATQLILALRAFRSPTPEQLCYNVASRCMLLGAHTDAADLSLQILAALRKPLSKAAEAKRAMTPAKTPARAACTPAQTPGAGPSAADCDGPTEGHAPLGGESGESCILAASAIGLHLKALILLCSGEPNAVSAVPRILYAAPIALRWLRQLHGADGASEDRKENALAKHKAVAAAAAAASERVLPVLQALLLLLRREQGVDACALDSWEAEAASLGRAAPKPACSEAVAYAAAAKLLSTTAPLRKTGARPPSSSVALAQHAAPARTPPRCTHTPQHRASVLAAPAGEATVAPLSSSGAEAVQGHLRAAASSARASEELDAPGCQALASALNALYQAYAARGGSLPMRRLDDAAATSALPLPLPLLALLAAALDRFVEVIDAGAALERKAAAAADKGSAGAPRPVFSSLGPKQAGILVAAAKLRFACEAATGASDAEAEQVPRDWVAGLVCRLARAACVLVHGAGATQAEHVKLAAPAAVASPPAAELTPVWVARTCQQLAAKLFNASQPRRAFLLIECCVSLLQPAGGDASSGGAAREAEAREAATVLCGAHQIGAHCMLQARPEAPGLARRHALAAIQARCWLDRLLNADAESPPDGAKAPSAPTLRELCCLSVSCLVRALADEAAPAGAAAKGRGQGRGGAVAEEVEVRQILSFTFTLHYLTLRVNPKP